MPRELSQRAQDFRERWLAPSGGWLAELTILLSDATGVWDLIVLAGIFVSGWIVIRTSPMEIAMILGLGFDLTIPLQYQNDDILSSRHATHLENYWPILMVGCICEGLSFFLLHPDLFTLIVCIKTMFMLLVWLSKDQQGLSVTRRPRSSRSGDRKPSSRRPSSGGGGRGSEDGSKYRSRSRHGALTDSSAPSDSGSDSSPSKRERRSSGHSNKKSSSGSSNMPKSRHVSDPYKYLHSAGYSDPAIAGMILGMNGADKDTARRNMKTWAQEKDPKHVKRRNEQYAKRAKDAGWPEKWKDGNPPSGSGGGGGGKRSKKQEALQKLAVPVESVRKVEAMLKKTDVPAENQKKILSVLKNPQDEREIAAVVRALKELGIDVRGPEMQFGYGEPDGKGGRRDILLSTDNAQLLIHKLSKLKPSKDELNRWAKYLSEPRSRREFEEKILPLGRKLDVYVGEGYTGGGPHGFDPQRLQQKVKPDLMERLGVSSAMADHMILKAINMKTKEEAQAQIGQWLSRGFAKGEYDELHRTLPDWA